MAYKTFATKTQYTSYQRRSLINGLAVGPKTKMKAYDVSFYRYVSEPASVSGIQRSHYGAPWVEITGAIDRATEGDLGRFDVNQPFFYSPLGVSYAGELDEEAHAKLRAKVHKQKDDGFNAAVFAAELGQTMSMFASTAIRVNRSARAARRGNFREAWDALGMSYSPRRSGIGTGKPTSRPNVRVDDGTITGRSADLLLEWSYGVLPLMNDLDAAAHKLATYISGKPAVHVVRGRASRTVTSTSTLRPGVVLTTTTQLSLQHTLQYRFSDGLVAHASSLGLTNPGLLLYEKTPLSFVLDWFINLGEWLRAFSSFHGLEFMQGCTGAKGHTEQRVTYPGSSRRGTVSYSYYDAAGQEVFEAHPGLIEETSASAVYSKQSGFRRTLWSSFPALPPLRFELPTKGLGAKFANSVALLRQRRSGLGAIDSMFAQKRT